MNEALPAAAEAGDRLVSVGGDPMKKLIGAGEVCPGSETPTEAIPAVAIRLAGTVAFSVVEFMKLVLSAAPFQVTVVADSKPEPLTVNVKPGAPAPTLVGEILLRTRGAGVMVKVRGDG